MREGGHGLCRPGERGGAEERSEESETREIGDKVKKGDRIEDKKRLGEWRNIPPIRALSVLHS